MRFGQYNPNLHTSNDDLATINNSADHALRFCNGAETCSASDATCQAVDCSTIGNKSDCNAEATCRWDNRSKSCVPN